MIFVQGQDGLFYVNPKIGGKSWFLDFHEDGIAVRVKKYGSTSGSSGAARARRLLKESKVKALVGALIEDDSTLFPPDFSTLEPAVSYQVIVKEPIPTPAIFDEAVTAPALEHRMLAWKMEFSKQDIKDALDPKKAINRMLVKFLTGQSLLRRDEAENVREILRDRLPGFKKFRKNPDEWFESQPDKIMLVL